MLCKPFGKSVLRVILDTNQFVSSLISKQGPSAQLLQAWRGGLYVLITSIEIIKELEKVIHYPHIAKKYHLSETDIESLLLLIERDAIVLTDTPHLDIIKNDPDDNKFLACALKSKADYIVSGDWHLLSIGKYMETSIITARQFLNLLDSPSV